MGYIDSKVISLSSPFALQCMALFLGADLGNTGGTALAEVVYMWGSVKSVKLVCCT